MISTRNLQLDLTQLRTRILRGTYLPTPGPILRNKISWPPVGGQKFLESIHDFIKGNIDPCTGFTHKSHNDINSDHIHSVSLSLVMISHRSSWGSGLRNYCFFIPYDFTKSWSFGKVNHSTRGGFLKSTRYFPSWSAVKWHCDPVKILTLSNRSSSWVNFEWLISSGHFLGSA